jgi:Transposase domain (DUF772)
MLMTRSEQLGMFDAVGLVGPLPVGSFFGLLAEHGDRIVRDEDFAACYAAGRGRPSIPPSLLARVLLLQHRTGASDEQAMEAVRWDLRWKVALGLPVDHQGWHPTSLTKFRARLLLHGQERLALEATLRLAGDLGLLVGRPEQIVDSTPMLGAAATQDTVRLVRSGVRRLLDAVAAVDGEAAARLDAGLAFDYARPAQKPDCVWRVRSERERMLTRVAQDAERALRAVEQADGLCVDERVAEAQRLLRELIGQDFDIDQDGVPRLHRGTRPGRIVSTAVAPVPLRLVFRLGRPREEVVWVGGGIRRSSAVERSIWSRQGRRSPRSRGCWRSATSPSTRGGGRSRSTGASCRG